MFAAEGTMIKVVGGIYRSRNLEVPESLTVPTKSRVREAVASSLLGRLEGAVVADIFAGSGAMGIEFLSRGARKAYFIEKDTHDVIRRNLTTLKETRGVVLSCDFREGVRRIEEPLDIVFLDPPYAMKDSYGEAIALLNERGLLKEDTDILIEFEGDTPSIPEGFAIIKEKRYGYTRVSYIRKV